jgi:Tol biopolymer transport system component
MIRFRYILLTALCCVIYVLGTLSISTSHAQSPAQLPENTPVPQPTIGFAGDKFTQVSISSYVLNSIGRPMLSFLNTNDKPATRTPGTPTAANQLETIYIVSPNGGTPTRVIDLPATTGQQVYWSPNGAYLAYLIPTGSSAGFYMLDLKLGLSIRLFDLDNLNPRGIASSPVWSPDSTQITLALSTAYDVDVYSINADGSNFRNMTQHAAFDFWPTWSPDGQYLAFISDRDVCPTWVPDAPNSCYSPTLTAPDGGNLYIIEVVSGVVKKVSDQWVIAPPYWISPTRLAFTSGKRGDVSAGSSLWWADLRGGPANRVSTDKPGLLATRDTWSADGKRVVYQEAENETRIVIRDESGKEVAHSTELNFPRVAFSASWSPDGTRVVMGGRNGQCPYGMLLTDQDFQVILQSAPNPGVCEPVWSPGGQYIAFNGVVFTAGTDGRMDVYIGEASGLAIRNVSGRLGGQIRLLGWIGGQ